MLALGNKRQYFTRALFIAFGVAVVLFLFAHEARAVTFKGGQLTESEVWTKAGSPYVISPGIFVMHDTTLTIEPGTIVKFMENTEIEASFGSLIARGTEDEPIIFTSYHDDSVGGDTDENGSSVTPVAGAWREIDLYYSNDVLEHVEIRYATTCLLVAETNNTFQNNVMKNCGTGILTTTRFTGQILNNVIQDSTFGLRMRIDQNGTYKNNKILNSSYLGVDWVGNSQQNQGVVFQGNVVSGSPRGMEVDNISEAVISGNNIEGNSGYGLYNRYPVYLVDARNNWWGDPSGPFHPNSNPGGQGNQISDSVLFDPVLSQPVVVPEGSSGKRPVLIIPGILGSAEKNGQLVIDPILHTYDDLIATLLANGFEEDVTLFTFPYEWRDSNTLNALRLRDRINEVQAVCECEKIDLVAHSMGGLIARQYIQFGHYEEDVRKLIFLGTPHLGSQEAYLRWEGGEFGPGFLNALSKVFFTAEAKKNSFRELHDYIRGRPVLSVQELLPIFNYLKDKDTETLREYFSNYPRNFFLESTGSSLSQLFSKGVDVYNIIGDNLNDDTIEYIRVGENSILGSGKWDHGEPENYYIPFTDRGLEYGAGDGTVTIYSATAGGLLAGEQIASVHVRIPTDAEARVFEILTGEGPTIILDRGFNISPKVLLFQLFSPVDMYIEDPAGNKMGKNFETGEEFDEIENAFYTGFRTDIEYITILDPLDGEYKIVLQGTDSGGEYRVSTTYLTDDQEVNGVFDGVTGIEQISNLAFSFKSNDLEDITINSTDQFTSSDLIYHINLAYGFGWIDDEKTKDKLLKWAQSIIRFEEKSDTIQVLEKVVDKKLAKMLHDELPKLLGKEEINLSAYNLLKKDLEWLINN